MTLESLYCFMLQVVVELLRTIKDETTQAKAAADTRDLLHQFQSFKVLLAMVVLKQLLEHTDVVSQYLQSMQIDLGVIVSSKQATLSVLKDIGVNESFMNALRWLPLMLDAEVPAILSTRRESLKDLIKCGRQSTTMR